MMMTTLSLRRKLIWSLVICFSALIGLYAILGQSARAAPADCSNGVSSDVTQDTTWSGEVYISGGVSIENSATLTITAGAELFFCDTYQLHVGELFDPGRLVAEGTADQPVRFSGVDDETRWNGIYFGDHLDEGPSILQHVVIENAGVDPAQGQAINVSDRALASGYHTPLLDHVTVRNTNGHGIRVEGSGADPRPALLTNVTVEGSSLHPVNVDVNAVTGIGHGFSASGNVTETIRVFNNRMNYDSHWRDHGLPYELTGGFEIRSNYEDEDVVPAVWTIDPGVTVRMHPGVSIGVGSLYGEGQVMARGTAESPITFTRLNEDSDPWGGFTWGGHSDLDSEFEHVDITYGGGLTDNREAVFVNSGNGRVFLTNVSIQHSLNGAVWNFGGSTWIKDSVLNNNRYGVDVQNRTVVKVRGSDLSNNAQFALRNGAPDRVCIDAVGNYWGPGGPADDSDSEDACGSTRTNDGAATVSDGVTYTPWQSEGEGGFGSLRPENFWVVSDGRDVTEITVRLLDEQGQPLAGKEVSLETTLGAVQQPASPTDEGGETTAVISSTETGFATITAMNVTDGTPVPGTAGVNFWQGGGDFGGLVDPEGAPYASPIFQVTGKPFQQGFPVEMRMPMQNTRSTSVDVEVVYGVTGLSIGARFTPVFTDTRTLAPGERWDARGVWVPDVTGHHCIQATLRYDDGAALQVGPRTVLDSGEGSRQINTDQNPCTGLPSGPDDFAPSPDDVEGSSEDLNVAAEHFRDQGRNMGDAVKCLDEQLEFQRFALGPQQVRDYETIVKPPTFTPPEIHSGPNLTAEQAEALNALHQTSAEALGLSQAIAVTQQRMQAAARADELGHLDRQYAAYLDFVERYIQALRTWADQTDDFLAATEGAGVPDVTFYPEDYRSALDDLVQNGFDEEALEYMRESGMSQELIDELRQDIIERAQDQSFQTGSFYQSVRTGRDSARRIAERLERRYDLGNGAASSRPHATTFVSVAGEPQAYDFAVSHPFDQEETVNLVMREVSLPMDWSVHLDHENVTLDVGETMSNTLTLIPGESVPEGSTVEVAVEGYVDGEHIGGILFRYEAPMVSNPRPTDQLFLPAIRR